MYFIRSLLILILCNYTMGMLAQYGCTDSTANNFDPGAKYNDGSCLYSPTKGNPLLKAPLNQISESSGLLYPDGKLWTFGDSGNPAEIFSVDTITGDIIQIVHIHNYPNTDWEDIAADNDYIYIGDMGNNIGNRTDLKILKIAKSEIGEASQLSVNAEAIQFSYQDQRSYTPDYQTNFDSEALISFRDSLYLFTKDHGDYKTRVYALPKIPGDYKVRPITEYNIGGEVTGADYDTLSNKIILIGYEGSKLNSFLYILDEFQGNQFFTGNRKKVMIGTNNTQWQTEGICFVNSERIFISCESTSDVEASLYTLDLDHLEIGMTSVPQNENTGLRVFPNPAEAYIMIQSDEPVKSIRLSDLQGHVVLNTSVNSCSCRLDLHNQNIDPGLYFLKIRQSGKIFVYKIVVCN